MIAARYTAQCTARRASTIPQADPTETTASSQKMTDWVVAAAVEPALARTLFTVPHRPLWSLRPYRRGPRSRGIP